jgi:hypothetical protein
MRASLFREIDNFLWNLSLGLTGDLELYLDRPKNLTRLSGYGIGAVRHHLIGLQIRQRLPKDVLQAASG